MQPALAAPALGSQRSHEPFTHWPPLGLPVHSPSLLQPTHWNRPMPAALQMGVLPLATQPTLPVGLQPKQLPFTHCMPFAHGCSPSQPTQALDEPSQMGFGFRQPELASAGSHSAQAPPTH